ncbi:MAG: hypothetical protein IPI49_14305 [Myxococcales bacterium]|nr:hypothetical protein [Myxococcales bacterium]
MHRTLGWVCASLALALVLATGPAAAGPDADVTTVGGDQRDSFVRTSIEYRQSRETSQVVREDVGAAGTDPLGAVPVRDDLDSEHVRHTVTPRLEAAVSRSLWMTLALPIVVSDTRTLSLHSGVDRASSTTLLDGFLPMAGYDADHPSTGFADGDDRVFRGRQRRGLDQVLVGLGVTLMNQRRDPHKPTWKVGAEAGIAVGKVARFDSMNPGGNEAVGRGVHEIHLFTTVAKRVSFVEPYFSLSWKAPVLVKDASLYQDLGYGSTNVLPPQQAQLRFGIEAAALDRPARDLRIGVDLGTRLDARFEGRDYSELWEVFALAGNANAANAPLVLDADPVTTGRQDLSHPGISNVENHLDLGAQLAVRAQLGKNFQLAALAELVWKTDHAITFADAGIDLPSCSAGQTAGCEVLNNDLIDAGTEEENPAFAPQVDLVGHRYRSVSGAGLVLGFMAQGSF